MAGNKNSGRKPYAPSDADREKVRILKAGGMSNEAIAAAMRITPPTLSKHFSSDLADGVAKVRAELLLALYGAAIRGNVAAQKKALELVAASAAGERLKDRETPPATRLWLRRGDASWGRRKSSSKQRRKWRRAASSLRQRARGWYIANDRNACVVDRLPRLERKFNQVESGLDEDGDTIQTFLAKHLNIEIGTNLRAGRWPGADYWLGAEDQELASLPHWSALQRLKARCEVCVVGLDGGGLDDLFGTTVLGREKHFIEVEVLDEPTEEIQTLRVKPWLSWSHGHCQRIVLQRRQSIATVLEDIAKSRELTILNKPGGDVLAVVKIVEDLKNANLLGGVVADPAGLSEIIDALEGIGLTEESGLLIGQQQGGYLMGAIKTTERFLASGQLKHSGGPLMQWCVPNLKIEQMATTIRATKQTAGDAKIDPAISLFNAVAQMSRNPAAYRKPEYQMLII